MLGAEDLEAVWLSLRVAAAATLFGLPVAALAALALARARAGVRIVLDVLVTLPLVLPPVATGYVLLVLFGRQGPLGGPLAEAGIVFAFDWTGAALAAGIMAFPLMVRPLRLAFEAVDRDLLDAAQTLGAGRLARLAAITLPLAAPGAAAAAILGFAKALGEFGATITFVAAIPGETLTLPAAIYNAAQAPGGEARALALCLTAAAIAVLAVAASDLVSRMAVRAVGVRRA